MHTPFWRWLYRWGPALGLMAAIFALSSLPAAAVYRVSSPVVGTLNETAPAAARLQVNWLKVGHVLGYAGLGLAFLRGFGLRRGQARAAGLAALACTLFAGTDELHQAFVPGRSAGAEDVALDAAAALAAILIFLMIMWLYNTNKKTASRRI
jgi:VanZ family protein